MHRDDVIEVLKVAFREEEKANWNLCFIDSDLDGLAQAALTALEAAGLAVVPGWQPIESAPRDGTPFIAKAFVSSTKTGDEWEETHVIWCDDETGEIHSDCEQGWEVDNYSLWMPLPAAPTAAGEG